MVKKYTQIDRMEFINFKFKHTALWEKYFYKHRGDLIQTLIGLII